MSSNKNLGKPVFTRLHKDRFGYPTRMKGARINALLGKKPLTRKQIVEATGFTATMIERHLKRMVENGQIVRTKDGYRVG